MSSDSFTGARRDGVLPILDQPPPAENAGEFLCARCARYMSTCCQTSEVYATPGDVARIEEFTGQTGFTEFRSPEDPVYLLNDDDPAWRQFVFRSDGTRRIVRRHPSGDCVFLGERGCVLPLEVRPLICRIYPYDFNEQGLKEKLARGCPTELLPSGQSLLEALEMDRGDAIRWHAQLYQEIRQERHEAAGA